MEFTHSDSNPTPDSIQLIGYAPTVNVASNMSHMININIGKPKSLLVTKESIRWVVRAVSLFPKVSVSFNAPEINPYFSFAIADSTSSPNVFSIFILSLSRIAIHLS